MALEKGIAGMQVPEPQGDVDSIDHTIYIHYYISADHSSGLGKLLKINVLKWESRPAGGRSAPRNSLCVCLLASPPPPPLSVFPLRTPLRALRCPCAALCLPALRCSARVPAALCLSLILYRCRCGGAGVLLQPSRPTNLLPIVCKAHTATH
jgi:hypothetical protein